MQLSLSPSELLELKKIQHNVTGISYVKVTCIVMLAKKVAVSNVADFLGIDLSTVYRYCNSYQTQGIDSLLENRYKGYWGVLSCVQMSVLRAELKSNIYTNSKEVCAFIKSSFGIDYTHQGVVDLLNRIGFSYKKTKEVPCECDAEKQQEFAKELATILETMDKSSVVYYADGVHPTHNSRSTYAWIEKGTDFEQPMVSGRDRVNINGLLNAKDVTDVIVVDSESVNAQSTIALYQAAIDKNPNAKEIFIISDNAKYYRNKELLKWLQGTKIRQVFLPPYSPNLNLIERLWKFLRKKVINTGFFRTKEKFRSAVLKFFADIANFKPELETLLTLNFRLCNSQTISF